MVVDASEEENSMSAANYSMSAARHKSGGHPKHRALLAIPESARRGFWDCRGMCDPLTKALLCISFKNSQPGDGQ